MLTITLAALQAIQTEVVDLRAADIVEVHIAESEGRHIVTLDAVYGTYSFYVERDGTTTPAGLGESAQEVGLSRG